MRIVLSGFHPFFLNWENPRMISYVVAVPEDGSAPPRTQAVSVRCVSTTGRTARERSNNSPSLWLPMTTTSSLIWPGITAIVFQIGVTLVSTSLTKWTSLDPGPVQYACNPCGSPSSPPIQSGEISPAGLPCPMRVLSNGRASMYEIGRDGMDGMLPSSDLVAFGYAGVPGVAGSPGYYGTRS